MNKLQHQQILSALIDYDDKESLKKYFNFYAFAQYCTALQNAQTYCATGVNLRLALLNCFNGRLLDIVLKSVNCDKSNNDERNGFYKKLFLEDE